MFRKIAILACFLFCLAVPAFATDVTISSTQIRYWDGPTSGVELRLTLDQSIVTPQQQNFPANATVIRVACTIAPETVNGVTQYVLIIPTIVLPATRDALIGRTARYTARFYRTGTTTVIKAWVGYDSFALASTPTTTTWGAIALSNQNGGPPVLGDNIAYSRDETRSLLNSIGGYTNSTAFTLGAATSPTIGNFDIRAGSGSNVPTIRYSATAGCWQSSVDGLSFTCIGSGGGGGGSGTVSAGTTNQLAYYAANGTVVTGLNLGPSLSIVGGALTVTFPSPSSPSNIIQVANAKIDHGCIGDDIVDDTACLTAAIASALSTGRNVRIPAGTYRTTAKITVPGPVVVVGDGPDKTIIHGRANDVILDLVPGTGAFLFTGPVVRELAVQGTDTGASQIGIRVTSSPYMEHVEVNRVKVYDAGSHGMYFGNVFGSLFEDITSGSHQGYAFLYDSANMPGNVFRKLRVGDVSSAAPAGIRIRKGEFYCESCNGMNVSASNSWNVTIGDKIGVDGASSNVAAAATWVNSNFESARTGGIQHLSSSRSDFLGFNSFVGDGGATGTYVALKYEVDTSIYPPYFTKGTINDGVVFANSPSSYYLNNSPIHSNDLPRIKVDGQGPKIAGGDFINSYYNLTNSRTEMLYRADGYYVPVAVTTSTTFQNPGIRAYEVTCASNCVQTLPWPGWYSPGELITVKNLSTTGVNVTINASSGGTVNGAGSYLLSTQGESVILLPSSTALDYRIVADRNLSSGGGGVASVFGRTGAVVAQSGDYTFSQISGFVQAGQMPAHTGDVTSSAGSVVLTVANDAVTFAKMQNVATGVLLGRSTAGTGDVETVTIGANLTLAAGVLSATGGGGSITVQDETVSQGTATTFNFAGTGVTASVAGSVATITIPGVGANLPQATLVSSNYTALTTDWLVSMDATAGVRTVTLYAASGNSGRIIQVYKRDTGANQVNVTDGTTTWSLYAAGLGIQLVSDGTSWLVHTP